MIAIIELIVIVYAIIYSLVKGYRKEKLWALAPIGLYLIIVNIIAIIGSIFYGPENYHKISGSPISIISGIISAVLLFGLCIWIVNHIKLNKAKRMAEDDDS